MAINFLYPDYEVVRNQDRCIGCRVCERQCANEVHSYNAELDKMLSDETKCVNCHRCVTLCPTHALKIVKNDHTFKENANWSGKTIQEIYKQANTGGVLLSSMGNPEPYPVYFDKLLLNASQVTNPPIDPLREPMETKVFLGAKPSRVQRDEKGELVNNLSPQIKLSVPIMFSAMSYGSISYNAHASLARAAQELGILYNTGEGGTPRGFRQVRGKHHRAGGIRQIRRPQGLSGKRRCHRDQDGTGCKARHRGTPARRKDRGGCGKDPYGARGQRRHFSGAPPRHLLHRGSAAVGILSEGGDRLHQAGDREDRRRSQYFRHCQRHCPQRCGHHRH